MARLRHRVAGAGLPAHGVFLRRQYLAFLGQSHPELAARSVRRGGAAAVEEVGVKWTWNFWTMSDADALVVAVNRGRLDPLSAADSAAPADVPALWHETV